MLICSPARYCTAAALGDMKQKHHYADIHTRRQRHVCYLPSYKRFVHVWDAKPAERDMARANTKNK